MMDPPPSEDYKSLHRDNGEALKLLKASTRKYNTLLQLIFYWSKQDTWFSQLQSGMVAHKKPGTAATPRSLICRDGEGSKDLLI